MHLIRQIITGVSSQTKEVVKASARSGAKLLGFDMLSKQQTEAFLTPYYVGSTPGSVVQLPDVFDAAHPDKQLFSQTEISTDPTTIWHYKRGAETATLLPCGVLQIGRRVLNTDYGGSDLINDVFGRKKREQRDVQTLVAPFGRYFDGNVFVGYYDYMCLVAAKLCRMKAMIPDEIFANAVVAYPLVYTNYEQEVLELLGFRSDQVFDSRLTSFRFNECLLGSHTNWAHHSVGDIQTLRDQLEIRLPLEQPTSNRNRIYISRSGRRRVLNEEELVKLLAKYQFQIIEDRPRSVVEQRAIYKNASFIVGPHGASFINLIWCEPGTQLLELFAPTFVNDCFLYISQIQGVKYSAYCQGPVQPIDMRSVADDITVSIDELERYLDHLFATSSAQSL